MRLLWITIIVSIFINFNSAVVIRRRPISVQGRVSHTTNAPAKTTKTTTTTTESPISEEIIEEQEEEAVDNRLSRLTLPSNATSIRSDITDNFSCSGRSYGYYADIENDCQIFHVCLPVTYPDGREQQFRWSFICPEETTFDQEAFTCVRTDEMNNDCSESERFYELNRILGIKEEVNTEEVTTNELISNDNKFNNDGNRFVQQNKIENNQRFRVTPPSTINPVRYTAQEGGFRSPIYKRTTIPNEFHSDSTEKIIYSTRFPERYSELNRDKGELFTTTPRDDTTTNRELTTNYDNFDFTTNSEKRPDFTYAVNEYTTTRNDQNTRIVPDLLEMNDRNTANADEVVDTIKQLQNIFPSSGTDDSRTKRFLFKADSVKNRQKLFTSLNNKN